MHRFVYLLAVITLGSSAVATATASPSVRPALVVLAGARMADPRPAPSVPDDDRSVVVTIVHRAVTEIKLCGFALERSGTAEIRGLCRVTSAENARTAIAGMQVAKAIGATAARLEPSAGLQSLLDSLAPLSGHEFDRTFLLMEIDNAQRAESTVRYAIEVASGSNLRNYETAVLGAVERHLVLAESALTRVTVNAP